MGSRNRNRFGPLFDGGSFHYETPTPGQDYPGYSGYTSYETMNDSTQPAPFTADQDMSKWKVVVVPHRLVGETNYYSKFTPGLVVGKQVYQGYVISNLLARHTDGAPGLPVNWGYWQTKALANLSPYRSKVNLPLALAELRELPRLAKSIGDALLSGKKAPRVDRVAGGYVEWSFGWAPLINDILSLFNFAKSFEDRKNYFRKLEKGTYVKRTIGSDVYVDTTNPFYIPATRLGTPYLAKGEIRDRVQLKVWYSVKAKLKYPADYAPHEIKALPWASVLGLTANPANLWDAIPWSWLVDYFVNVGDVLEAANGLAHLDVSKLCIMATTTSSRTLESGQYAPGLTGFGGSIKLIYKERSVTNYPIPWLSHTPYLGAHQLAILGSIGLGRRAFHSR